MSLRRDKARKVFPRWRSLARTTRAEFESADRLEPVVQKAETESRFQALYEKWREAPSLENAAEAINGAVLFQRPQLAVGPAKAIARHPHATSTIKRVAEFVLEGSRISDPEIGARTPEPGDIVLKIKGIKKRVLDEPRNGLLWLEKSRLQTLIGDRTGAKHSIERALGCEPESRQILRAFATFSAHIGHPEEGRDRLRRASRLAADPWIQSAEIALSEAAGSTPISVRRARDILRDANFNPKQISELASAMATLEADAGANIRAKKLFKQSLERPTDNALSQAYWARDALQINIGIAGRMLEIRGAFEARVQAALEERDWNQAVDNCSKWLGDEPFSRRAASEGSFVATSLKWSPEEAIGFCDRGLVANPNDFMILNNKAVALARLGLATEAKRVALSVSPRNEEEKAFATATLGLAEFRMGNSDIGRTHYLDAVEIARKMKSLDVEFNALGHWIYEEWTSGCLTPGEMEKIDKMMARGLAKANTRAVTKDAWGVIKGRIEKETATATRTADAALENKMVRQQVQQVLQRIGDDA